MRWGDFRIFDSVFEKSIYAFVGFGTGIGILKRGLSLTCDFGWTGLDISLWLLELPACCSRCCLLFFCDGVSYFCFFSFPLLVFFSFLLSGFVVIASCLFLLVIVQTVNM